MNKFIKLFIFIFISLLLTSCVMEDEKIASDSMYDTIEDWYNANGIYAQNYNPDKSKGYVFLPNSSYDTFGDTLNIKSNEIYIWTLYSGDISNVTHTTLVDKTSITSEELGGPFEIVVKVEITPIGGGSIRHSYFTFRFRY